MFAKYGFNKIHFYNILEKDGFEKVLKNGCKCKQDYVWLS